MPEQSRAGTVMVRDSVRYCTHLESSGDVVARVGCNCQEAGGLKGRQRGVLEQRDARADVLERVKVEGGHGVVVGDQRVAGDALQLVKAGLIRQRRGRDL